MINSGETYTAINGQKFECIFVEGGTAWMRSHFAGTAYRWDAVTGASLCLGAEYDLQPAKRHLPEYTTEVEIGSTSMQIGVDYTYEPGTPARPQSMNCPGEPPEGPDVQIGAVYWRHDDDKAPWKPASAVLAALLIDAMGGEVSLVEDLIAHAEGRAEAEAHDHADYMRDMAREAAE